MTLLKDILRLVEVTEPVDPGLPLEDQIEILEKRLAAAKRGLGFANKLKNPMQKKKHMALVLTNLNKIRSSLGKVIEYIAQFDRAESDYKFTNDIDGNTDYGVKRPTGMDPDEFYQQRAMGESRTYKMGVNDKKRVEKGKSKAFKAKKAQQVDETMMIDRSMYDRAYKAGRNAAKQGHSLDEMPPYDHSELESAWEKGWYAVMDSPHDHE